MGGAAPCPAPRAPTPASPAGQAEMRLLLLVPLLLAPAPGSSVSSTLRLHHAPPRPGRTLLGRRGRGLGRGPEPPTAGAPPAVAPSPGEGQVGDGDGGVGGGEPSAPAPSEGCDLETSRLALGHSLQKWQRPSALPLQNVLGGTANVGNVLSGWYITVEGRGDQCWQQPRCRARWPNPPDVCHLPGTKLSCSSMGLFGPRGLRCQPFPTAFGVSI